MSKKTKRPSRATEGRAESNLYAAPRSEVGTAEAGAVSVAEAPEARGVRFRHLNGAFRVASQQQGVWIVILLLLIPVGLALNFGVSVGLAILSTVIGGTLISIDAPQFVFDGATLAMQGGALLLGSAITAVILGGLFRTACKQVRGERIRVGDASLPVRRFPQVVLAVVLIELLTLLAVGLVVAPFALLPTPPEGAQFGIGLIAVALVAIAFGVVTSRLMLVIPLVVDGNERAIAAIRKSWVALRGWTFSAIVFHALAAIFSMLGAILLVFGLLLTIPVYYVAIALVYRDHFPHKSDAPA